jgi:hypothetical protein
MSNFLIANNASKAAKTPDFIGYRGSTTTSNEGASILEQNI